MGESCHGQVAALAELPVLYAGLDLSAVNDLSAFVLVGKKGENWHSHCRFWLPQDGLADKAAANHAPYDAWARQGVRSENLIRVDDVTESLKLVE